MTRQTRQHIRARHQIQIDRVRAKEDPLASFKVHVEVGLGGNSAKGRVVCTRTRLIFCVRTPMGIQLTLMWREEVEAITSGMRKGMPYAQFLGQKSRILVLFKHKETRDRFLQLLSQESREA